jgi:hypothetical protein
LAKLLPAWGETEADIGGTIADALNSVFRRAQFLERVLGFLKTLGELAPPCAVVPLSAARAELVAEAADIRRTLLPSVAPEIRDATTKGLDKLDAQIAKIPTDVQSWRDAPTQWRVGASEGTVRVPTGKLGATTPPAPVLPSWEDAKDAAEVLLHLGTLGWLISTGPAGAVVAGVMYGGGIGERLTSLVEGRIGDAPAGLKPVLQGIMSNYLRFEQRTKPAVYQQVLGAWMLTQSSPSPEVMRAGMTNMNPYLLPPMPEVWDGSFKHLATAEKAPESGSWLIALLLGSFLGLSVAVLTE